MKILVTGGAGFVGSHVSEFYANKGHDVVVYDNLSRAELLKKDDKNSKFNWNYLKQFKNIKMIKGDIREFDKLKEAAGEADVVIHTAGQTAVTTSVVDPVSDFYVNALGTFNVLESARQSSKKPTIVYCSTNKVYGENVNNIPVEERDTYYKFASGHTGGVKENFSIDNCEHTPYGCSKLTGDLYMQDYAHLYGLKIGIFRMSCIYGTRQFGFEDQGWVAWFTIAALLGKPITIYGDGKQVRDVLYVTDLVNVFDKFINSGLQCGIFNTGGGATNTISLLQLLSQLEDISGKKNKVSFAPWRPSDQKVYISDISKVKEKLDWEPKIRPDEGIKKIVSWVKENKDIF
ncbi:GDP-mannose 4,6-dehydratase [bacterium]|nr:GDP-mannose 4,6-dehydratase [bacterium]